MSNGTPAGASIDTLQEAADVFRKAVQETDMEGGTDFHATALSQIIRRVDSDIDDLKAAYDSLEEDIAEAAAVDEDEEDDDEESQPT